jgi:hypothetical protein
MGFSSSIGLRNVPSANAGVAHAASTAKTPFTIDREITWASIRRRQRQTNSTRNDPGAR